MAQLVRKLGREAVGKVASSLAASFADAYCDMNEVGDSTEGNRSVLENALANGFDAQPEKLVANAATHNKTI